MWMPVAAEVFGGREQVGVAVDAYCNPAKFLDEKQTPTLCNGRESYGAAKYLISHVDGTFEEFAPELVTEIKSMQSFRALELFLKPGKPIKPTIDCFTWGGCVLMSNSDEAELNRDYARIEEMCTDGSLYLLLPPPSSTAAEKRAKQAVIVVDPFSTGATLAAELHGRGHPVLCVYSSRLSTLGDLVNFVPQGVELHFCSVIGQPEGNDDGAAVEVDGAGAADWTAGEVAKAAVAHGLEVVGCFAGAETGVGLCDRLAERLNLRGNGSDGTEARRDKFFMQEKVRAHPDPSNTNPGSFTRAIEQIKVTEVGRDLEEWLAKLSPVSFKVIVKPVESAGSDDVKLCLSKADALSHAAYILSKSNLLGCKNDGVLAQEYIEGREYVVDTVSRNGEHKVVALWEYDKKAVNGHEAPLVYFGQKTLVPSEEPNEEVLLRVIAYQKNVLDALGIVNGPAHAEIKVVGGKEPVLIEVGARSHG